MNPRISQKPKQKNPIFAGRPFHVASIIYKSFNTSTWKAICELLKIRLKSKMCHESGQDAEWRTYGLNILNMYECFQSD